MSGRRSGRLGAVVALLAVAVLPLRAQQTAGGRIEGTVTDARSRQPLSAASVFIQGTNFGTQTNERGHYVLVNVPAGRVEVRVRRIGYTNVMRPVTVAAGQSATLNVDMTEAAVSLDQVVVTGTAIATRAKEVPTSTDIVNMENLKAAPVRNAQDVLAGRIPSVMVQANSGQPGAGGTIKIRGTNTISQNTDPLIYVDGVRIFNETTRNNWGARTGSNPLQDINPDDIERLEVVKGAAATTLYGTEASAGVIQIFTKKGMAGKPEWATNLTTGANLNSQWGNKADPTHLFTVCNVKANNYGLILTGSKAGQKQYFEDPTCPADGNWTSPGPIQQYDLSVRGGGSKITYFVSGNFNNIRGILPTQKNKEGGFRANFGFFPLDQLQLSVNTSYLRRNVRWAGDGNNSEGFLLNVGRGWRGYMQGGIGDECKRAGVPDDKVCITNGHVFEQNLTTKTDHFLSGVTLNYVTSEHLSNRFAVGWDYTVGNNVTNLPFGFLDFPQGSFFDENSGHTKLSLDYAGSFQVNPFTPTLQSTFSWGGQLFRDHHRWTELDVQTFAGPGSPTLRTGSELTYREDQPSTVTNAGFFLQEALAFHDRLFVTGGLRVDGNSAFGSKLGLQSYPKIGVSYVLSDHAFWPKDVVETFKVRGAMGESGKAPGAFDKLRTWSPITGDENKPGFTPSLRGNPNLGPERTRELEAGFDAGALNGLLGVEFTGFRARTYDALVPVSRAPSGGFSAAQLENVGLLQNSGVETQLTLNPVRTTNLEWRLRGTFSRQWSIAKNLGETAPGNAITQIYTGLNSYIKTGHAFPAYYGKKVLNPNEDADPKIGKDSLLGLVNPDRMFGVGTTLTFFNNLSVDAFLEHQGGFVVQNYTGYQNARRGVWYPCYDTQLKVIAAAQAKQTLTGVRAVDRAKCAASAYDIGYWTDPGDFTKLRYVSLTYNLPGQFLRANRASLTVAGRNLWTSTKYTGADPEVQDVGDQANLVGTSGRFGRRDYYQIPQPKTVTVSLRATF